MTMTPLSAYFLGIATVLILALILGPRRRPVALDSGDALSRCKEGGYHEWGDWEDYLHDPRTGGLSQVRRCSKCNLGNQANMLPILVSVERKIALD